MWKIFKTVGVLSAIGLLVGLFYTINSPTVVTDIPATNSAPQTKSEPKAEVQPTPAGEDPFKKFLDQKTDSSNTATKSDSSQALPIQPGNDPFKEFLDKQKQNSKDQVVSPFGKN